MDLFAESEQLLHEMYNAYRTNGDLEYDKEYSINYTGKNPNAVVSQLKTAGFIDILLNSDSGSAFLLRLTKAGIEYIEKPKTPGPRSATFNFYGNISNSIVGTQQNATINQEGSLEKIKDLINKLPQEDRAALEDVPAKLEKIVAEAKPVKKGMLTKISDGLKKHETLIIEISKFLMQCGLLID